MNIKVIYSTDPSGYAPDITEEISLPDNTCLFCLHDKRNRLLDVVVEELKNKGCNIGWYFQPLKIYVIEDVKAKRIHKLEKIFL